MPSTAASGPVLDSLGELFDFVQSVEDAGGDDVLSAIEDILIEFLSEIRQLGRSLFQVFVVFSSLFLGAQAFAFLERIQRRPVQGSIAFGTVLGLPVRLRLGRADGARADHEKGEDKYQ